MELYDMRGLGYVTTRMNIEKKCIIYVARVKLVYCNTRNILRSTDFSNIIFSPTIPESHLIGSNIRSSIPCDCILK
ncbi:hypothetical protein Hanom_Chr09g00764941 [Helianthus anomalus]